MRVEDSGEGVGSSHTFHLQSSRMASTRGTAARTAELERSTWLKLKYWVKVGVRFGFGAGLGLGQGWGWGWWLGLGVRARAGLRLRASPGPKHRSARRGRLLAARVRTQRRQVVPVVHVCAIK